MADPVQKIQETWALASSVSVEDTLEAALEDALEFALNDGQVTEAEKATLDHWASKLPRDAGAAFKRKVELKLQLPKRLSEVPYASYMNSNPKYVVDEYTFDYGSFAGWQNYAKLSPQAQAKIP